MPDEVAMWAAAGLAAVFAVWRFWRLMAARVHVPIATEMIVKLVRAGNLDRARKLCAAAPGSVYLTSVRAALGAGDGARSRFAEAFAQAMAPLESHRWMDLTALAAALLALVIATTTTSLSLPVLLLGAAAGLGALFNVRAMRRLRRDPPLAFATIADALGGEAESAPPRAAPDPPAPVTASASPPASRLDLRTGTCPLCGGSDIAERPAIGGDLVPWVCERCGHAQLFARR